MEPIKVMETKYKCEHCGRLFDRSVDCAAHESICHNAEPVRDLAAQLTTLLKMAATMGVPIENLCDNSNSPACAEFDETGWSIQLLPF